VMRGAGRVFWIAGAGLAAIGGSCWFRVQQSNAADSARTQLAVRTQFAAPDPAAQGLEARIAMLQQAAARSPKAVSPRLLLARTYQQSGQRERAAEQCEAVVRLAPSDREARLMLAQLRLDLMQFKQAEVAYSAVTRRWAESDVAWQGLAAALHYQQRYLEAVEAARKAVHLRPAEATHRYILAISLLEYAMQFPDPQIRLTDLKEARQELLRLSALWPDNGSVLYRLGRTCAALGDGEGALKHLRRASELLTDHQGAVVELAQAHARAGDYASAARVLEPALARHADDPMLHSLLGQTLQTAGEPGAEVKALASFRTAVRLAPDSAFFQEKLGTAALKANRLREARAAFEAACRLNPHRSFPRQQLATIYTRQGDVQRAVEAARTARELASNEQQLDRLGALSLARPKDSRLHLVLADRYRDLGLTTAARDEYLAVLRLDRRDERARQGIAGLAKETARPPQP
jgi:tetratricopeptide (TPR) repeat protein